MSKRLQVLVEDHELDEIRRAAKGRRVTVAEWVRQTLREARRGESPRDPAEKLSALRRATAHSFPTADIDRMLAEIERGDVPAAGR